MRDEPMMPLPVLIIILVALAVLYGWAYSDTQNKIEKCIQSGGYPVVSEGVFRGCAKGRPQ